MTVPRKKEYCQPVHVDLFNNLLVIKFEDMLGKFISSGETSSSVPPVLTKEGELYIFDLGTDTLQWDKCKKKFRYSDIKVII